MGLGGLSCGVKCAKLILFVFNFIFWLSGAAMLGVGIWFLVDNSSLSNVFEFLTKVDGITNDNTMRNAAILFIAVGGFVFIVGFCGCCGAIKEVKCLLGLYVLFLVIVLAAELAAGIMAVIYRNQVEDTIKEQTKIYIRDEYMNDNAADYGFNYFQFWGKCCGIEGPRDWMGSKYVNGTTPLPTTVSPYCCVMKDDYKFKEDSTDFKDITLCTTAAALCMTGSCPSNEDYLYTQGCYSSMKDWIKDHVPIFIGVGIGIACLEIFGIVFAICLCRAIGKDD